MSWKDFLPISFESEKPSVLDVKKPIKPQVAGTPAPNFNIPAEQPSQATFNPNPPNYGPSAPVYTPAQPSYTSYATPLSSEDQKKWVDYMTTIYNDARKQNGVFDDFENQIDTLAAVIPQEGARISAIGVLMAQKGITKAQVIDAANHVMQIVNDAKATFQQDLANRRKTGIDDAQASIQQKQQQIQQLQQEIAQLNQSIGDNTGKLAVREQGFNQCWGAVVAKLTNDINNINNFVQG